MWIRESGGGEPTQVYPMGDIREHVTDGRPCWCKPTIEIADDGEAEIIHNSADGREDFEQGLRKPC